MTGVLSRFIVIIFLFSGNQEKRPPAEIHLNENSDCKRVIAYLCKTRGLDYQLISGLVRDGKIAQEVNFGNVLFKYFDESGKLVGAEKCGTSTEKKFKGIEKGSSSEYGFEVVRGKGENALFFESSIDMLSYLQMHSSELNNHRLVSMMGVKPETVLSVMKRKHIPPENIYLCSDNDTAGNDFADRLRQQYPEMKRIVTPERYKDWNDLLRGIPKEREIKDEQKEVGNLITYGNKTWNDATDNREKTLITMSEQQFREVCEKLDSDAGLNFFAYIKNGTAVMAVNDKDVDCLKQILGQEIQTKKSEIPYTPPQKNIIGTAVYRYIPDKRFISADRDTALKMAQLMEKQNIPFSGIVYPNGKATLTVSGADFQKANDFMQLVIAMRKQFAPPQQSSEIIGNKNYRDIRQKNYFYTKITPEQYREIKPFLDANPVEYSGLIRNGKVTFTVEKADSVAFHNALETAQKEVQMTKDLQNMHFDSTQMMKLDSLIHKLSAQENTIHLEDFFDSRYDEMQFDEMLSLMEQYLETGDNAVFSDMIDLKNQFNMDSVPHEEVQETGEILHNDSYTKPKLTKLEQIFMNPDSDIDVLLAELALTPEQLDSLSRRFIENPSEHISKENVIDWLGGQEVFVTKKGNEFHAEYGEDSMTVRFGNAEREFSYEQMVEAFDWAFNEKYEEIEAEREQQAQLKKEEEFLNSDIPVAMAKHLLTMNSIERIGYMFFDEGYAETHKPFDDALFGNGLKGSRLYELAVMNRNGEDIRREFALSLLDGQTSFTIEPDNEFQLEYGENFITATCGGAKREIPYEVLEQTFYQLIKNVHDDIINRRTIEDLQYIIPELTHETAEKLIQTFDNAVTPDWKNDSEKESDNQKCPLHAILGDDEQTEKAFASIADMKYNYKEPVKPDSLEFHFGKDEDGEWFTESELLSEFVEQNPNISFALANAVMEYLDEKQHSERSVEGLHVGWYDKTDFEITASVNGEDFHYDGRFDIGDGKNTGGGSLIDHIRTYNEGIIGYTQYPYNTPESKEKAQHTLDVFVPFLEKHSVLTPEEEQILSDFKEQYPIRTADDVEIEKMSLSDIVERFLSGDDSVIETPDGEWKIANGGYDLVAEIYHNNIPVCGIINDIDGYQVNDYHNDDDVAQTVANAVKKCGIQVTNEQDIFEEDEQKKVHQVITNAGDDGGIDEKPEYATIEKAVSAGREYLDNDYLGFCVYNQETKMIEHIEGDFPLDKAFNPDILRLNGIEADDEDKKSPDIQQAEPIDKGTVTMRKVGDFWEMYRKNAEIAADVLGLHMTKRGIDDMVGFPDHVKNEYCDKLKQAGYTVLIEEVFELNPPKREISPLERAKQLIKDFVEEFDVGVDFDDLSHVNLAFRFDKETKLPVMVYADLENFSIIKEYNDEIVSTTNYDTLEIMCQDLEKLNFNQLVTLSDEEKSKVKTADTPEIQEVSDNQPIDEDTPLFSDEKVIQAIQNSEKSDEPFQFQPDTAGEQLSLFGDSEPIQNQKKEKYQTDLFVGGVNRFTALHDDIMGGTGFQDGKFRVQEFYQKNNPTNHEFAEFLKDAYGTGGHSGNGEIAFVDYDSKGMYFKLETGEKFKFTWSDVAEMISATIDKGEYLTQQDIENHERFSTPAPIISSKENIPADKIKPEISSNDRFTTLTNEQRNFAENFPPITEPYYSMWGEVQECTEIANGVFQVSTPSHGGMMIAADLAEQVLSLEAIDIGYYEDGFYSFEEDCNAQVPLRELLDKGVVEKEQYFKGNGEEFNQALNETIARSHHKYWALHEKAGLTEKSEITPDNLEVGDKFSFDDKEYEVYSLSADKAVLGFKDNYEGHSFTNFIEVSKKELLDESVYLGNAYAHHHVQNPKSEKAVSDSKESKTFTITDDSLGEGGAKSKFRANIEAIRTLKTLEKEKRPATDEEKETLSRYVGWGGIAQAFDENNPAWTNEYQELKSLLTPQEYTSARATTLDAFYTTPTVINAIYEALENFGFEGGNVLEPAMGVGNFFGCMPEEMQKNSNLYGVEIDSISGRIAQKIYPDADIAIQGFENNHFQNGCFDVAVGNVPFGDLGFKDEMHGTSKLHDYFFAESLDKLKNGGIIAFVTSSGTLDKQDESVRQMLADKADFIGAVRLPGGKNGAFKDNANTEVTTDIIFLQKHDGKSVSEMLDVPDWVRIGETADGLPINKYFEQNPDMVLGTVIEGNKLYGKSGTMVVPFEGADLKTQLHEAVSKLSAQISDERGRDVYARTEHGAVKIPSNLRNYSFFEHENNIYFKKGDNAFEFRFDRTNSQHKRFKAFIALRDTTRELLTAQEFDKPDSEIKALQEKLTKLYDDFYKKYGLIHNQTNKRYFGEDVSYNLVAGLEKKFDKTKLIEKSDIFTQRTIQPPKAVEHVETALEALTLSMAEKAGVDFDYMSSLTGMTEDELKHDLTGEIFKVPHTENTYQTASEYLSGDIRQKLNIAEELAEYDSDFNINVNALRQAMPEPLKAGDIDVKLGATWINPKYYEQFMYELFQTPNDCRADVPHYSWAKPQLITAEYSEHTGSWHINHKNSDKSVLSTQKYGSQKMNAYEIMEHLLNLKEPKIYKTIEVPDGMGDTKEKRVVDIDATRVVQRKADTIRSEFKKWIFKDSARREDIVNRYNELFNSVRPREYDGSHLTFPMMNSSITLHEHQKNAIAHAMFGGNTLFAHCVGAGKTFEMIATAMESKRLGLCTKSLFAVPNHLTEQIGDDFMKLYPSANILVATKNDFKKENRQQLFAKIATLSEILGHSGANVTMRVYLHTSMERKTACMSLVKEIA